MKRIILTLLTVIASVSAPVAHGSDNIGKVLTPLGNESDVEVMFITKSMLSMLANRLPIDKLGDNIESIQIYSCNNASSAKMLKGMMTQISHLENMELLLKSKEQSREISVYGEPRSHQKGQYSSFIFFRFTPGPKAQVILFNGDFTSDNIGTTIKTLPN